MPGVKEPHERAGLAPVTPRKRPRRQRGDGSLYQRASDGLWMGEVVVGYRADGRKRVKTVSSKDQATAVRKLRDLRRQLDEHGDLPTASTTVERWLVRWLEEVAAPRLRPKTLAGYRDDARLHITPAVGRYRLDKLTPAHVRAMGQAIVGKGNSSTTALRCHRVLSKALTDAQREGLVVRNVAALVDAPRRAASSRGALSAAQGIALLRAVEVDPLGSRWAAALLTGARQGELLGLERDRVGDVLDLSWQLQRLGWRHGCADRKTPATRTGVGDSHHTSWPCERSRAGSCPRRQLDVPAGFEHRPLDGGLVLTRPKTRAGHRVIPLVEPLRAILARHLNAVPANRHGLVWARDDGRPIDPSVDSAAWHEALRRAELPPVPLHAARHTAASLLLEAGVDAHVVMTILGRSTIAMSRSYQHVPLGLSTDALTRLGRLLTAGG